MGNRVARVGADCHLQGGARLVVLLLLGVKHSKVVIGFGQFREFFRELAENVNRVGWPAHVGKDQPL